MFEERAPQYPQIETKRPLEIQDDPAHNSVLVTEHYSIPGMWLRKDDWRWGCDFYPQSLENALDWQVSARRRMPLGLRHPRRHLHTTVINLPDDIRLRDEATTIRGPAEELHYKRISYGRTMTVEFDYRSLADSVPAAQMADHAFARRQMIERLGTSLVWRSPRTTPLVKPPPPAPPVLKWGGIAFAAVMFLVWRVVLRTQGSKEMEL